MLQLRMEQESSSQKAMAKFYYQTQNITGQELHDWFKYHNIKYGPIKRVDRGEPPEYYITIFGEASDTIFKLTMDEYILDEYIENFPDFTLKE